MSLETAIGRNHLSKHGNLLISAICLAVLAAVLRFHSLGVWAYSGDESATLTEERIMFHAQPVPDGDQAYRLPRLIPVSYLLFHAGHTLFGSDERGFRTMSALLGTLCVMLTFLLLDGPMGRPTALATALLMALMPQHVAHSQEARFYVVAALFGSACLLVGARLLWNPGGRSMHRAEIYRAMLAGALACAATLSHSLLLIMLPLLCTAVAAGARTGHRTLPRAVWGMFAAAALLLAAFAIFYVRPLVHDWNQGADWGYSTLHSVLGSIVMIGWPVALLAAVGALLMLRDPSAQNAYWLVCLLGWLAATILLPLIMVYHVEYSFPFVLGALVAAGYAIAVIYRLLLARSALAAGAWLGTICLVNVPALASHFVDGSRIDERGAVQYVREHWQSGDRVTGYAVSLFRLYAKGCCAPSFPLSRGPQSVAELKRLGSAGGRLWIVLDRSRAGLDPATQRWLFDCSVHKFSIGGRRYDEAEYAVDIYLVTTRVVADCEA